jgi:diphthamide biosynthesis methyltransferase
MIDANYVSGLHSLVLLDLDPTGMGFDPPKPMQPAEAVAMLERMVDRLVEEQGEKKSLEVPVRDWNGILLSDIGTEQQRVIAGRLSDLSGVEGGWIHTLILPAKMSGNEHEAFERRSVG